MTKRTLVISLSTAWVNHFAIELEYIYDQLERGHEVVALACHGGIERCLAKMYDNNPDICNSCVHRRSVAYDRFSKNPRFSVLPVIYDSYNLSNDIVDILDVESFHLDGHNLGIGALSSAIYSNRNLPLSGYAPATVLQYLKSSASVYSTLVSHGVTSLDYTNALIFNGRFAEHHAALCVVRSRLHNYTIYEGLGPDSMYVLFENGSPHSVAAQTFRISKYIRGVQTDETVSQIGESFFETKRRGGFSNDIAYISSDYQPFTRPDYLLDKKIITVFTSSEDESRYTEYRHEYRNEWYKNQVDAIRQISDGLAGSDDFALVIRIHPNMVNGNDAELSELKSLANAGRFIILPDDKISSYSLMDQSYAVITFYSTIGIEATYWGIPSYNLCKTPASNIGATHYVNSLVDFLTIINGHCKPCDRQKAVAYGASQLLGERFKLITGSWPDYYLGSTNLTALGSSRLESRVFCKLQALGMSVSIATTMSRPLRILSFLKHKLKVICSLKRD